MPQLLFSSHIVFVTTLYVSFALESIVITSRGEEGAGRCAGCLLVCRECVVPSFTTLPVVVRGGL